MSIYGNLVIVRGIPGSGKSTFAIEKYVKPFGYKHFEADMYFMKDGIYCYDARQIPLAHKWCFEETRNALEAGENVVVANTFTTAKELYSYFLFNPKVYRCTGNFNSVHNVPEEVMQRMRDRWEDIDGEIFV